MRLIARALAAAALLVAPVSLAAQTLEDTTLRFSVQVLASENLADAEEVRAEWHSPERPFIIAPVDVNGTIYYRVLAGLLPDRASAEALMATLVQEGIKESAAAWHVRSADQAFEMGRYATLAEANAAAQALLARDIPSYPVISVGDGSARSYILYAGGYGSADEASYLRGALADRGLATPLISRDGLNPSLTQLAEALPAADLQPEQAPEEVAAPEEEVVEPPVEVEPSVEEVVEPPEEEEVVPPVEEVVEPPVEEVEPPVEDVVEPPEEEEVVPPVEEVVEPPEEEETPPQREAPPPEEVRPPEPEPAPEVTVDRTARPVTSGERRVIRRSARRTLARSSFGVGAEHQYFSFDEPSAVGIRSLTLTTIPVGAKIVFPRGVQLEIQSAYARARSLGIGGAETEITGPTDTWARITVPIKGVFSISGDFVAPTGEVTYTLEQIDVAGAIAADLLPFRISNWGAGGGFGVSAGFADQIGGLGIALSGGVFQSGEFDPIEGTDAAYRPGNNVSARVALDHTVGKAGKFSILGTAQLYDDDEFAGQNLYRSGDRYQVLASYAFAMGASNSGIFYGGWLRRSEGAFLVQTRVAPAIDLAMAGFALRLRAGQVVVVPRIDGRALRNDLGEDQGYTGRFGLSAELPIGTDFKLIPFGRGHIGNVEVLQGVESLFTGFDAGVTLRYAPPGSSQ